MKIIYLDNELKPGMAKNLIMQKVQNFFRINFILQEIP